MLRRVGLFGLLAATTLLLCGCPPPAKEGGDATPTPTAAGGTGAPAPLTGTLTMGHYASLTGNTAMFGKTTEEGVRLAEAELNGAGGVQVKIETLNDSSLKEQVVPVVTRLISEYHASALIGEVASSRSIAAAPIANSRQVPMVSPSSTNPDVTVDPLSHKTYPYVFRVCFTDPFQGAVMARFVRENLKLSRAAVLKDVKNAYSVGLANGFRDRFTKIGGTIISEEAYSEGDTDFRGQLTKIMGQKPELLVVPGYYREAGLIVQQARTLGLKVPVIGGDGWDSPTLTDVGAQYFNDCYFSNHFSPEEKRPGVQEFVKAYQAKFRNEMPNALAALGYDAVKLVADAAKRAGSTDPKAIRTQLEQTKDYPGVTGMITIDPEHNAVKSAVIVKVESVGGKANFPLVTTIAP